MNPDVIEKVYQENLEERLISYLAESKDISLEEAMEIYYNSRLAIIACSSGHIQPRYGAKITIGLPVMADIFLSYNLHARYLTFRFLRVKLMLRDLITAHIGVRLYMIRRQGSSCP